jgi:hypothetical protein
MNKTLAVAILLLGVFAIGFATNKSNAVPAGPFIGPHVIATAKATNQTAPITSTTIFTPPISGLYRISSYMATTTPGTLDNGYWTLVLGWTDDAGVEGMSPLELRGVVSPPNAFGFTAQAGDYNSFLGGGSSFVFRAIAGSPVTYSVLNTGTDGTYEVFLVAERLD